MNLVQIAKPVEGVPTLSITYHTQQDLTSAVNGLINSSYVQQVIDKVGTPSTGFAICTSAPPFSGAAERITSIII
jgi:hypothetical protein